MSAVVQVPTALAAEHERRPAAMESPDMYGKAHRKGTVRFALKVDGGDREVEVAGDFSNWQPIAMKRCKDGTFVRHVHVGKDAFEYKFLVNGRWINDPDHSVWTPNGLGSFNSLGRPGRHRAVSGIPIARAHAPGGQKRR